MDNVNIASIVENMFRLNMSVNRISQSVGIPVRQVTDIILAKGLSRKNCNVVRDRNICDDYMNGEKIINLSTKYNLERHKITDILRREGVYINRFASYDTNEKQERNDLIVTLYNEGNSISEVSKITGINNSTVARVLRILNIQKRPQHQQGHSKGTRKNAKYQWDIDFFESIDTEHKAYWLGFLYADSYNGEKTIIVDLSDKDISHIKLLQQDLKATEIPLVNRTQNHSVALHLRSVKMKRDLERVGCVNKKTLILTFPSYIQVPSHLISHFMRGYFDGDGSVQLYQRKNRPSQTLYFEVIGTYEFLNGYENELRKHCHRVQVTKRQQISKQHENIQSLRYGGNLLVKDIYDFLYKDATIYLERKKSIFEEIVGRPDYNAE